MINSLIFKQEKNKRIQINSSFSLLNMTVKSETWTINNLPKAKFYLLIHKYIPFISLIIKIVYTFVFKKSSIKAYQKSL